MSKNKKNFIIGTICSAILFFISVIYLTIPAYYGIESMININTNNLFISIIIVYSILHLVKYFIMGPYPRHESLSLCITATITGIINVILNCFIEDNMALSMSLALFVLGITGVKLFTVDYYHDHKDVYFYIEAMFLGVFFIVGIISSFNLFSDSILQTIMLGFFFIIISIIDACNNALKCMLKAKRFLKKIKLK